MMEFDGEQVSKEFERVFGNPIETLTVQQVWFLVKMIKHCRYRCRNNAALNKYLSRNFPHLKFNTVEKTNYKGEEYDSLEITERLKKSED